MEKVFWAKYHLFIVIVLVIIWLFTEVVRSGKDISDNLKDSGKKSKKSIGESVMLFVILGFIVCLISWAIKYIISKNIIASYWLVITYAVVYAYIAIRQMVKIIFFPERGSFSSDDIRYFVLTYVLWFIMMYAMSISQSTISTINGFSQSYGQLIKVVMLLLCCYFNNLFALGGTYIFLYYLRKGGNKLYTILSPIGVKLKNYISKRSSSYEQKQGFSGLKCFSSWEENKRVLYKIVMTFLYLVRDIVVVSILFIKIMCKTIVIEVFNAVIDPLKALCKLVKTLWNKYENNEWMYIFAQISGICSYFIIYLVIQFGEYVDSTENVYEFFGSIILIPYFLGKIVNIKRLKVK